MRVLVMLVLLALLGHIIWELLVWLFSLLVFALALIGNGIVRLVRKQQNKEEE